MRVTRAGSCETIAWSWAAVLLGSSTVLRILAVISGSVAIPLTFEIACLTSAAVAGACATLAGFAGVVVDAAAGAVIGFPLPGVCGNVRVFYRDRTQST